MACRGMSQVSQLAVLQELGPLVLPHLRELLAAESVRKLGFCFSSSVPWWKQQDGSNMKQHIITSLTSYY